MPISETISNAANMFVDKMIEFADTSVLPKGDDLEVFIDGDLGLIHPDGTYTSDSPAVKAALDKHFAPLLGKPANGPSDLPTGQVDPVPSKPFQAQPKEAAPAVDSKPAPAGGNDSPKPAVATTIYDRIVAMFGYDLLEVMGETGTMKTQGLIALAKQCATAGKRVFYLDTENNVGPEGVKELQALGVKYHYTPVLKEIDNIIRKEIPPMKVDLIVIDSVGLPILRRYATLSVKERGDALLELIAWFGILKEVTYQNKCVAFVSNQQGSEFGKTDAKEKGDYRAGFGDKAQYIPGAILLAKKVADLPGGSRAEWKVWRLRRKAWGVKIFEISVNDAGASISMVVA